MVRTIKIGIDAYIERGVPSKLAAVAVPSIKIMWESAFCMEVGRSEPKSGRNSLFLDTRARTGHGRAPNPGLSRTFWDSWHLYNWYTVHIGMVERTLL